MLSGCIEENNFDIPHEGRWGIYSLDIDTQETTLIFELPNEVSNISLNSSGDTIVFSMRLNGDENTDEEICIVSIYGKEFKAVTSNEYWDLYPTWSSYNEKIAFLSWRDSDLDIYVIDTTGEDERLLYDSGHHDADIHWGGDKIVFTSQSCINIIEDTGDNVRKVTSPQNAGIWGNANLPFGDYDPRLDPSGSKIIFERLEDDASPHGNYNLFSINTDGTNEKRLTDTGYSQGFACWSHSGENIVFLVAAIDQEGIYDIYMMDKDRNNVRNITPDYYPNNFLCHVPIFSKNDDKIYFIGEWWQ